MKDRFYHTYYNDFGALDYYVYYASIMINDGSIFLEYQRQIQCKFFRVLP